MDSSGFLGIDDYLKLPRERETWLVKPLIPISGAALLYGVEKSGKSYLAVQLALAISSGADEWLGFPIIQHGRVLYLQLDTPRSVWAHRFDEMVHKSKVPYDSDMLKLADREKDSFEKYPFDILLPAHVKHMFDKVKPHDAVAVIIDTLRESHSGDEDSSTIARNVVANLVGAVHPAALILISHSRKPSPDVDKNIMADHRGSSYITGRMDAIMRLTKSKLYYSGRSIEEGDIKLRRLDSGLWEVQPEEDLKVAALKVLTDQTLTSLRAKARAMSVIVSKSEEACMSYLRRNLSKLEMPASPLESTIKGENINEPVVS